jgi:hypothetical protein
MYIKFIINYFLIERKNNMEIQIRPIEKLIDYVRNPRKNDGVIEKMKGSIKEFGFRIPILIKSDGTIIDGHLRKKAASALGIKELPCIIADDLTEAQIKAFRLVANQSANWADWDIDLLSLEIDELKLEGFELEDLGFDEMPLDSEDNEKNEVDEEKIEGDIKFSKFIDESNNYIILTFNSDIDWLSAMTHFGIESKIYSKRANDKEWSAGIGRVIDGGEYLTRITGENKK